ncbi:MAG TPA: hypothetical protein PKU95_03605, partial [Candidatus Dojkabacteria bacterium]|nr:hypothetical protein [Candidatus Dojkabacteria bacterium]
NPAGGKGVWGEFRPAGNKTPQPGLGGFKISLCFCLDFGFQADTNPPLFSRNGFLLGKLWYPSCILFTANKLNPIINLKTCP